MSRVTTTRAKVKKRSLNLVPLMKPSDWLAISLVVAIAGLTFIDHVVSSGGQPIFWPDSDNYFSNLSFRGFAYGLISKIPQSVAPDNSLFVPWQLSAILISFCALGISVSLLTKNILWGAAVTALATLDRGVTLTSLSVLADAWFSALVVLHTAVALYAIKSRSGWALAYSSALAALAILVRPAGYSLLIGLLGLLVLVQLRPWWKGIVITAAAPVVILSLGTLPNLFTTGKLSTAELGGYVLLQHVLPLARPGMKTIDPELFAKIIERVEPLNGSKAASYPHDYWEVTTNQQILLFWQTAKPLIDEKYPETEQNDFDFRLAMDIIKSDPAMYGYLVGAHVYGMWYVTFSFTPNVSTKQIVTSLSDFSRERYNESSLLFRSTFEAPHYPGDGASGYVAPELWNTIATLLRILLPFICIIGLVSFGYTAFTLRSTVDLNPITRGAMYCFMQVWLGFLLVALSASAIPRYAVVWEPIIICGFVLLLARVVKTISTSLVRDWAMRDIE